MARELTPNQRIDQLRDEKGWMKAELAKRIGVHPSQIGRIISGDTASISSDILIGLAKAFGVSADYILGLTPVRAPKKTATSPNWVYRRSLSESCWTVPSIRTF